MIEALYEWLDDNKIVYQKIDNEVLMIPGMGKVFYQDMDKLDSIFRVNKDGVTVFNSIENPDILMYEGINYIAFQFGKNMYYYDLREEFSLNILKYVGEHIPTKRANKFIDLGIHTGYELLNGSGLPNAWIKKAKWLGYDTIGVCDYNTMASLYQLQKDCESAEMKYVFGYSLTFEDGENKVDAKIYATSQSGFDSMLRIQKAINVDREDGLIDIDELCNWSKGLILVMGKKSSQYIVDNFISLIKLKQRFNGAVYYQIDLSEYKAERIDVVVLNAIKLYFDELYEEIPPVLICDSYYLDKSDAKNKLILNKVAEGAAHEQSDDQYMKDLDEHYEKFEQLFDNNNWDVDALFDECCENTVIIAEQAKARIENTRNFMPHYDMTPEEKAKYGTSHNMFCCLLEDGLKRLVPPEKQEQYRKQMEYEKYIIESTNNVDYLLVQYDCINWCRTQDLQVGCGRGSAAGSLLLYLLGITLIDPIKYNLIFERFLLPERAGLYPSQTTVIGQDMESSNYVDITLEDGTKISIDADSQLYIRRGDKEMTIYADELQETDDILFDNKDEIFTLKELCN